MQESLDKLIKEHTKIFKMINYMLMDGLNISASNMPAEYAFIEENIELLSDYYDVLGYKLQNYDSNFYLSVVTKDRYTSFEYFTKAETFLGMYLAIKFFQNMEYPIINTKELFEDLSAIFALEHLYEIFVKRMQNFYDSGKRLDTVRDNFAKTLRQLYRYNFIDIVEGNALNIDNALIEVKGSIKRFLELALELYDKEKADDMKLENILDVFIKDTEFDVGEVE